MDCPRALLANNVKFLMATNPDLSNQTKLSARSKVGQTTVGRLLRCESDTGIETIAALAKAFRLGITDLLDPDLIARQSGKRSNLQGTKGTGGLVPLISWVAAGMMYEAIDNFQPGDADEWLESPFAHSKNTFCLKVIGGSMSPDYRDGEIIQVDPEAHPISGADVVVRTPDGHTTFKRLKITETGERFLEAANPAWPDRVIKVPEGTVICGTVTGSWIDRRLK